MTDESALFESVGPTTAGLPLEAATPPGWAEAATRDLSALLADHAHCEMKAAAMGFRLLGSYSESEELVDAMLALVREEMRHFERARSELEARGGRLGKAPPDRYVKALTQAAGPGPGLPKRVERLLLCAFIEARSCERFRALSRCATLEDGLRRFFAELAAAESRHHETFFRLARSLAGPELGGRVEARIAELARAEAEVIAGLEPLCAIH